jgi:hypothetical protein
MKQLPNYIMPAQPCPTDRIISRQFDYYNTLVQRYGAPMARQEVVAQLLAAAFWLDEVDGSRATYELLQKCADQTIAPQLCGHAAN